MIDNHSHLYLSDNPDQKIKENIGKLKYINENGLDTKSNRLVIEESKKYDFIYYSLGFHPEHLNNYKDDDIEKEIEFIKSIKDDKKFIGIGEIGLDYYMENFDKNRQIKVFNMFLEVAEDLKKPTIIHTRKAEEDILNILESYNNIKILHSFWKPKLIKKAIDIGCYISIPAFVYKDQGLQKIAKEVPLELLLTETDAPFLDPIEKHNNNSWKIEYGLKKIAEIKNIDAKELEEIIDKNFEKLYFK